MRAVLVIAFLMNLAAIVVTTAMMPERVAIHFGAGGEPDSWGPRAVNMWAFVGVSVLLFSIFVSAPAIVRVTPPSLVNVPNREYWLREENRDVMLTKVGSLMAEFGIVFFVFLGWMEVLVTMANLSDPVRLNERLFYPALIGSFGYALWWVYRTFCEFRVPENASDGSI